MLAAYRSDHRSIMQKNAARDSVETGLSVDATRAEAVHFDSHIRS